MLQSMNYIYEVYKERSFSRAAKNLYISQSSLSQTIRHAEERIGMEIFDRSSHPIRLTEFGELYIRSAEEIYGIVGSLESYVYDANHLKSGRLSIGAGNFFATYLVPPAIARFKEEHPNIQINLMEGRTVNLREELDKGNIELLISNGTLDEERYKKTVLFQEYMVLSVPKRFFEEPPCRDSLLSRQELFSMDRFQKTPPVSLTAFSRVPFILLRPGNDARIRAERMFAEERLSPAILLEPDQTSTAFAMSQSGMGATIIDDALVRTLEASEDIWIYKLPEAFSVRDVAVYWKRNGYVTRSMREFIRLMKEMEKL